VSFVSQIAWLVKRELRAESRQPRLIATAFLLALATVLLLAFGAEKPSADLAPTALWVGMTLAAVVAASDLYRSEHQEATLDVLLAGPMKPAALFVAKAAVLWFHLALIAAVNLLACALLFDVSIVGSGWLLAAILLAATAGLSLLASLLGAQMGGSTSDLVVALAMMPLAVPQVIAASRATAALFGPGPPPVTWLGFLLGFDLLLAVVGLWIFEPLVRK